MTEEIAKEKKARDVFEQLLRGKNLVEHECRFLKNFVDEKLEEQRIKREELGRIIEKSDGDKKSNGSYCSTDISSTLGDENPVSKQLENLRFSDDEDEVDVTKEEIEQEDRGISVSSSHSESQYDETQSTSSQKRYPNEPLVDYCSFVSMDNRFLHLTREPLPFADDLKSEAVEYPLNVQFDECRSEWYICDQMQSKIIKINTTEKLGGVEIIEHKSVPQPSAICIFKEGRSIAILCRRGGYSIVEYFSTDDSTFTFCSYKNPIYDMNDNLRGLAKTIDKNLMSLEVDKFKPTKYLRIFKKEVGASRFPIQGAIMPCFIASNGTNVAISDLRTNNVYLYKVDDTDWQHICFEPLRIIESKPASLTQLCNSSGFSYVAGLQFDVSGNLLIGDARGRTIKLYDHELNFLHRLSTDFSVPYMSSFWVNSKGKVMILNIRSPGDKIIYAQLDNVKEVKEWNAASIIESNRQNRRK